LNKTSGLSFAQIPIILTARMEKEIFKKFFPHLAEEMENGVSRVKLVDTEEDEKEGAPANSRKWAGHEPDVVDFIRRCEKAEQAKEIIEYMEAKGDITSVRATKLRRQLMDEGLESFGNRKDEGFYHRDR
jgi:hypothetical protein